MKKISDDVLELLAQAARRHVEEDGYDAWYILSAKHDLVYPTEIIEPYDLTIGDLDLRGLHVFRNRVDRLRCGDPGYGVWTQNGLRGLQVDVFAGAPYIAALPESWASLSWEFAYPLEGMQIGQRLAWFAEQRRLREQGGVDPEVELGGGHAERQAPGVAP